MAVLARLLGWVALALVAACGGGDGGGASSVEPVGTALMARKAAPDCGYAHVYVTVDKVLIDHTLRLTEVALTSPRRIDLMGLGSGVLAALGTAPLPAGHYSGIRLVLAANGPSGDASTANAVVPAGGALTPLSTPGAQHSGLKLQVDFDVTAQAPADVALQAFDACRSVVAAGKSGGYLLRPVIAARPIDATLLAKGEFRVNATMMGDQSFPAIATLANGGYVVVWMSSNQDGTGTSIYSQRYDRRGAPLGGEAPVSHSSAAEAQQYPQVAGLNDGGYVVVWASASAGYQVIYAQRFDAAGAAIGAATRVHPDTLPVAITPSVAALADGGFLVTWSSNFASIDAQRYDRNGNSLGGSTRVNVTEGGAWQSAVTGLRDGGYAVAWGLLPIDVPPPDVYTRRFDAAGVPVGGETRANTFTADAQQQPGIAALRDGGYVVTWMSQYQDGSGYGIYAQRFDGSGAPVGSETRINTVTSGSQEAPAIAGLGDGGYVVVWFNGDIKAQRFDSNGAPVGAEVRVNTAALSAAQPAITALPNGGYVVAWQSWTQDGSGSGVYAQQFDAQGVPR